MTKIYLILLSLSISYCIDQTHITRIIEDVLIGLFNVSSCIYFINNGDPIPNVLEKALLKIDIPIVAASHTMNDSFHNMIRCHYLIIVTLDQYFLEEVTRRFRPHQTVLIVSNCSASTFKLLTFTADTKGINIIIIDLVNIYTSIFELPNIDTSPIFKVTSLLKNETLFDLNYQNTTTVINKQDLNEINWNPQFPDESTFKISAFPCTPYVLFDQNGSVYDGVEHRIMKEIVKNFPVEYVIYPNVSNEVNLWKKVVADVSAKVSDIALCSHWLLPLLSEDIDVTYPYDQVCVTFLVPKPQMLPDITYFFQPLTVELWIFTIFLMFCLSVLVHVVARIYIQMGIPRHQYSDITLSVLDMIQSCVFGNLRYFPRFLRYKYEYLRIILTLICIQSTLLVTAYSAGFTSLSTKPRYSRPIQTFEDMLLQNVHWTDYDDADKEFFKNSSNPTIRKLPPLYVDVKISERNIKIRKNHYAMVTTLMHDNYITETETLDDYGKRHLKILSECFLKSYIVFPLIKDSPYTAIFDKYIVLFLEHGLIQHWYSDVRVKSGMTNMSPFFSIYSSLETGRSPLSLKKVQGGFTVLLCGYGFALLTFLIEKGVSRCKANTSSFNIE